MVQHVQEFLAETEEADDDVAMALGNVGLVVRKDAKPVVSAELFYDLCEGYIKPRELLADADDAKTVEAALALIRRLFRTLEEQGKLELI